MDSESPPGREYDPKRIIACETGAEALQWEAAERIHAGVQAGKSQRQIGREINRSQSHVKLCSLLWREYLGTHPGDRPPFNDAYQAAKRPREAPPDEPDPPEPTGDDGPDLADGSKDNQTPPVDETPEQRLARKQEELRQHVRAIQRALMAIETLSQGESDPLASDVYLQVQLLEHQTAQTKRSVESGSAHNPNGPEFRRKGRLRAVSERGLETG